MFATGIMMKYLKIKNIEDVIKQVYEIYIQRGFNTTRIHTDNNIEIL